VSRSCSFFRSFGGHSPLAKSSIHFGFIGLWKLHDGISSRSASHFERCHFERNPQPLFARHGSIDFELTF